MNARSRHSLVFTTVLLLSVATAPAASASDAPAAKKTPDRFDRTKEHIDALLKNRLKPEPLPATLPNPFFISEEMAAASASPTPGGTPGQGSEPDPHDTKAVFTVAPPSTDAEFLAFYAASLKINGTVLLNGRLQLVINQSTYKEGDLIVLHNKEASIYLKVLRIAPGELTLGYNGVEQTLKVKGN